MYTDFDLKLAWAAGLFEGEGCFTTRTVRRDDKSYIYPKMSLGTTDYDILCKFYQVVKCGHVNGPYRHKHYYKENWVWTLANNKLIDKLTTQFAPYLGERRLARAKELGIVFLP